LQLLRGPHSWFNNSWVINRAANACQTRSNRCRTWHMEIRRI
uniref:Envelope glycoprotein n=1 Tax=Haemonchus placei TaxID=6290 RepID=A0A0N4X7M2_HAEPC